jgi:fatty acid desaturase
VLLPALFWPLGRWAVLSVLINSVLAELLTNVHAFVTIVPNHAGEDLYRFEDRTHSRADFYLRQVLGSTNYRCGGDLVDIMHGWLNYQIEHHLWPDMSLLQYRRAQPKVREICERHGVPYVQESVWRRCRKAVAIMVGDASLRRA